MESLSTITRYNTMKTTHTLNPVKIPLLGIRPKGHDYLVVDASAAILRPENWMALEVLKHATYEMQVKSLELSLAWDHPQFGRSIIANVMMDEQWKCAHRKGPYSAPNVFTSVCFPDPAASPRRGGARRRLIASLTKTS